ncbi:MAG: Na/Pi cotransporter family protein [Planctomycetaceae bacterium]|nr:Na/Pi cotransporter family protein [Planctomycetaceae bacterium]
MWEQIAQVAGGLGLFLVGMNVMTQGLSALADDQLRKWLAKATRSPWMGAFTGTVVTILVQSSSATTVAAVGFVEAGLLTFPQSLGIIFGANIGTTVKGWFIAWLGLKLQLSDVVMPLVFLGALLRLMRHKRLSGLGSALAGFGMLFMGLALLQTGMAGLQSILNPQTFPPDTLLGRFFLVLIGLAFTVVTQSSSAGVAILLTALNTQSIHLGQALAMLIGMDLGTSVTALLASIGGRVGSRRTGFAHVVYNGMSSVCAYLLIPLYLIALDHLSPGLGQQEPEFALVGFHSLFNTLTVFAILPFTSQFAALIERLIPDHGHPLLQKLEPSLLATPKLALPAAVEMLKQLSTSLLQDLQSKLASPDVTSLRRKHDESPQYAEALDAGLEYLQRMEITPEQPLLFRKYSAALLLIDHLRRLERRLQQSSRIEHLHDDSRLNALTGNLSESVDLLLNSALVLSTEDLSALQIHYQQLRQDAKQHRQFVLEQVSRRELKTTTAVNRMDSVRWLRRISHHALEIGQLMQRLSSEEL